MTPEEARKLNEQYEQHRRWYREECLRQGLLPEPHKEEEK